MIEEGDGGKNKERKVPSKGLSLQVAMCFSTCLLATKDPLANFFFFFAMPNGMKNPSSSTSDQTCNPCIGSSAS